MKILQKLVKQRRESAEIYKTQNRPDLYENEVKEAAIIEEYLPRQMTEDELIPLLRDIMQRVGATSPRDMGKVMARPRKNWRVKPMGE